jgi:hypothetical protein
MRGHEGDAPERPAYGFVNERRADERAHGQSLIDDCQWHVSPADGVFAGGIAARGQPPGRVNDHALQFEEPGRRLVKDRPGAEELRQAGRPRSSTLLFH